MNRIILIGILILCVCVKSGFAQDAANLLETAYKKKDFKMLDAFFMNWHKDVQAITDEELSQMNDTVRNVYEIFKVFYKPVDIDILGGL